MLVRLLERVKLVNCQQLLNAYPPMLVTLSGMITLVKLPLLEKTESPIATVGYPPRVAGIEIAPPAPVYPVIVAFPSVTVYL